jgi:hypothetical protein
MTINLLGLTENGARERVGSTTSRRDAGVQQLKGGLRSRTTCEKPCGFLFDDHAVSRMGHASLCQLREASLTRQRFDSTSYRSNSSLYR